MDAVDYHITPHMLIYVHPSPSIKAPHTHPIPDPPPPLSLACCWVCERIRTPDISLLLAFREVPPIDHSLPEDMLELLEIEPNALSRVARQITVQLGLYARHWKWCGVCVCKKHN